MEPEEANHGPTIQERATGSLLAFAAGDALGWPNERRGAQTRHLPSQASSRFQEWQRRTSSRFLGFTELIEAGEYSDDTQLTVCLIRALVRGGDHWFNDFTTVELPQWLLYERGGGASVKRSARGWSSGIAPWDSPGRDRAAYYDAGGNGAAMRVLPHVLLRGGARPFREVRAAVFRDGLSTHGHPHALLGAQLMAYALWHLVHTGDRGLRYGELVEATSNAMSEWAVLDPPEDLWPSWLNNRQVSSTEPFERTWQDAVVRATRSLDILRTGIAAGALAIDREILDAIGAFAPATKGSGLISALGAIFLASRYADSPTEGLVRAAHMNGIDTDTIAAMTGALLGWLAPYLVLGEFGGRVQNEPYLRSLLPLLLDAPVDRVSERRPVTAAMLRRAQDQVEDAAEHATSFNLPDGRIAKVTRTRALGDLRGATRGAVYAVADEEGELLYVTVFRRDRNVSKPVDGPHTLPATMIAISTSRAKVVLPIAPQNWAPQIEFYASVLGRDVNVVGDTVMVSEEIGFSKRHSTGEPTHATIEIACSSLKDAWRAVEGYKLRIVHGIRLSAENAFFQCVDPGGYTLNLYELPS